MHNHKESAETRALIRVEASWSHDYLVQSSYSPLKHCAFQFFCLNVGVIYLDLAMHRCIKVITPANCNSIETCILLSAIDTLDSCDYLIWTLSLGRILGVYLIHVCHWPQWGLPYWIIGGRHVGQLPRQGVQELSIGSLEGWLLLLWVYNNDNDDNGGTMTQISRFSPLSKSARLKKKCKFGGTNVIVNPWISLDRHLPDFTQCDCQVPPLCESISTIYWHTLRPINQYRVNRFYWTVTGGGLSDELPLKSEIEKGEQFWKNNLQRKISLAFSGNGQNVPPSSKSWISACDLCSYFSTTSPPPEEKENNHLN